MPKIVGSLVQHPARVSFLWYASVIAIGAALLALPVSRAPGREPISPLDAVFTSTSATCVTGLVVRSTGNDFSLIGQAIILLLIQLGGIGIMTVTTFVTLRLGGRQSLRERTLLAETLGAGSEPDLKWVLTNVLLFTFFLEGTGFLVLSVRFLMDHPVFEALWYALFHSISAFCNAGFSLNDDSLIPYQGDLTINATIIVLLVAGGLGFPVMLDIARNWHGPWDRRWERLLLHSKIMLVGTAVLLTLGTVAFLVLEWDDMLVGMSIPRRLLVAVFHSATCRTAGFNTVDIGRLTNATLFISALLMMIGAGPCSTAGGFKVSTMVILVVRGWTTLLGQRRITLARRTIPQPVVDRAVTTAVLFSAVAIVALTGLLVIEQSTMPHAQSPNQFLDAMFEVVSALGTVGLSTGLTGKLSDAGCVIIIVLMFIGRLGPISVFVALSRGERPEPIEHAAEEPLIG